MLIPRIAITPGEPAGIGPDVCIKISQQDWPCDIIFITDPELLQRRAKSLGLVIKIQLIEPSTQRSTHQAGTMNVLPIQLVTEEVAGQLDIQNAGYVTKTLTRAAQLCLDGSCQAIVTGPVQKSIINDAGIPFSGHTEFFAEYCDSYPVMMLVTDKLKVALATTHLPLKDVSASITRSLLEKTIRILHNDLQTKFAIKQPRIAVCGLNPHAGENGHLGDEEITTIIPTLDVLRKKGIQLTGPLPADTIFTPAILNQHDVVLAMYHDQGLPTLKYSGFGNAVNITLGLPMIRTSVDHGTALDLAGTGKASSGSLEAALNKAIQLTLHQHVE